MRLILLVLAFLATPVLAETLAWRPSAKLLAAQADLFPPGICVVYEEGGNGLIIKEPVYFLKGEVVATDIRPHHLGICPQVPGKTLAQYSRDEFNRHVLAYPCVSPNVPERDEEIGIVRLRVTDWETPHARKMENAGRLYRGKFIDRELHKDIELELEADLLGACAK